MIKFSDFQPLQEAKNLHLTHIEETIITDGSSGAKEAVEFLKGVRQMLSSNMRSGVNVTTKWDGAPAIFCGIHPDTKKFFVATKSLFNKDAKINYTVDDIRKNHPGGVGPKLEVALAELSKLGIKGILQGDMMYTRSDLGSKKIDGEDMVTFQPNTIMYAVPKSGPLGKKITGSKMGIVFHTEYKGKTLETMKASFNINISKLRKTKSVWFRDASYQDVSGTATLTVTEGQALDEKIDNIESSLRGISKFLDEMAESFDEKNRFSVPTNFKVHLNSYFRGDGDLPSASATVNEFIDYWNVKLEKEIDSKKTEASKDKYREIHKDGLNKINASKDKLVQTVELYNNIMDAKNILVKKLEVVKDIGTFLVTDDGLKTTAPEGFVAVDRIKGNAVKLVNRLEFSRANFTATKNWVKGK